MLRRPTPPLATPQPAATDGRCTVRRMDAHIDADDHIASREALAEPLRGGTQRPHRLRATGGPSVGRQRSPQDQQQRPPTTAPALVSTPRIRNARGRSVSASVLRHLRAPQVGAGLRSPAQSPGRRPCSSTIGRRGRRLFLCTPPGRRCVSPPSCLCRSSMVVSLCGHTTSRHAKPSPRAS